MDQWSCADRAPEKLLLSENAEPRVERFGFLVWALALSSCVSLIQLGNFGNI